MVILFELIFFCVSVIVLLFSTQVERVWIIFDGLGRSSCVVI